MKFLKKNSIKITKENSKTVILMMKWVRNLTVTQSCWKELRTESWKLIMMKKNSHGLPSIKSKNNKLNSTIKCKKKLIPLKKNIKLKDSLLWLKSQKLLQVKNCKKASTLIMNSLNPSISTKLNQKL